MCCHCKNIWKLKSGYSLGIPKYAVLTVFWRFFQVALTVMSRTLLCYTHFSNLLMFYPVFLKLFQLCLLLWVWSYAPCYMLFYFLKIIQNVLLIKVRSLYFMLKSFKKNSSNFLKILPSVLVIMGRSFSVTAFVDNHIILLIFSASFIFTL